MLFWTMPLGALKRAAAPEPSALPDVPSVPAKVETVPSGAMRRMAWLPESAT